MRELTREEQLEYLIEFLENQIEAYQYDLEQAKIELDSLKNQKRERKKV
jgi:competence protein ComGC